MSDQAVPDQPLSQIYEFAAFIAQGAVSARQRERLVALAEIPVPAGPMAVLSAVGRREVVTISALARAMELDSTTMSRHVRRLEDHALVRRSSDPDDGRVSWLTITPAGRQAIDRVRTAAVADYAEATCDWPNADREQLGELLERLRLSLASRDARRREALAFPA